MKTALERYRRIKGSFPPASFVDDDSHAAHSWRVLILPYLTNSSLDDYRWDESWDSKHNSSIIPRSDSEHFQCASGSDVDRNEFTNYVCVQGEETVFTKGKSMEIDDITDGAENTIVLVEAHGLDIHWREPRDLEFANMSFELNDGNAPSISSPHPSGPVVSFAEGSCPRLSHTITRVDVKALLTRGGGDSPKRAELDRAGAILGR